IRVEQGGDAGAGEEPRSDGRAGRVRDAAPVGARSAVEVDGLEDAADETSRYVIDLVAHDVGVIPVGREGVRTGVVAAIVRVALRPPTGDGLERGRRARRELSVEEYAVGALDQERPLVLAQL